MANNQVIKILCFGDSITLGEKDCYGLLRFDHDIKHYNKMLKKLSDDMSCGYVDLYSLFKEKNKEDYLSEDGLHPNSKGHYLIYQAIKEKLSVL
jgi:lysophospholipase L1-like esterase